MTECQQFQLFVHAYVDGEFEQRERAEAEAHIAQCGECRDLARHHALFRRELVSAYQPEAAPSELRDRIVEGVAARAAVEARERKGVLSMTSIPRRRTVPWEWVAGPVLASAAAAAFVVLAMDSGEPPANDETALTAADILALDHATLSKDPIVTEAVTWHRRSVPVEVVGPNQKRVGRWFDGKVGFPVRLPNLDPTRAPGGRVNLLGARLSNVEKRQAAYVVYEVDGSKVSVLVFDGAERKAAANRLRPKAEDRRIRFQNSGGYNVAVVEDNGVSYSITSELPRKDMVELVEAAFHR